MQSKVALVGPSTLLREGLYAILKRSRFLVTASVSTVSDGLSYLDAVPADLLICALGHGQEKVELISELRKYRTKLEPMRIVLLTQYYSAELLRDAASVGVQSVLLSDVSNAVLLRSLELVMLGQPVFPAIVDEDQARDGGSLLTFDRPGKVAPTMPSIDQSEIYRSGSVAGLGVMFSPDQHRSTALSERERQIMSCLVNGAANKTIARDLQITEATVKVHIKGLLRKLGVTNRTQAAVWGLNNRSAFEISLPSKRCVTSDQPTAS